jgi:hypothetical protein
VLSMYCLMSLFGCGRLGSGRCWLFASIGTHCVNWCGRVASGEIFVWCVRHSMNAKVIVMSFRHLCMADWTRFFNVGMLSVGGVECHCLL